MFSAGFASAAGDASPTTAAIAASADALITGAFEDALASFQELQGIHHPSPLKVNCPLSPIAQLFATAR